MFSQSADQPAADQSPAPVGMRELPPQPAKPVMPAYATATSEDASQAAGPGPEDSVIAKDDHIEGTFTSRGTVVVMGSVKGRIEAIQVRIEQGASVDADVIVDEAIIAGEFTGNLTCRDRLEAHASGRINGRVETHKLMLHEGASVEGEMHMLTDAPKDATETIRGSAPLRGDNKGADPRPATEPQSGPGDGSTPVAATKPAPTVTPSSSARPASSAAGSPASPSSSAAGTASVARRESLSETLRAETLRVAPRATTTVASYSGPSTVSNGSRTRNSSDPTGF
jgi:cytoskeletal protein CcmA (bactofilin family)